MAYLDCIGIAASDGHSAEDKTSLSGEATNLQFCRESRFSGRSHYQIH
jgi:hypothetical protein